MSRIRNPITDQFRTVDGRENRFMARAEQDAPLVVWGGQDEGESFVPLRAADCVCEEPCRYCHCKETE